MNDKIRLVAVEPDDQGGLIHYMYQLCTALANEGVDVTLITGTDYEMAGLPHNFRVKRLLRLWQRFDPASMQNPIPSPLTRRFRKLYWVMRQAFRAIRLVLAWARMTIYLLRHRPDIVLFSRIQFSFEALFIRLLRGRGMVLSQICHEFEARERSKGLTSGFLDVGGNVYEQFSMIFFHAQENRRKFLSYFPQISEKQTHLIEHGNSGWLKLLGSRPGLVQELRAKYRLSAGERVVLFFGLLSPSKGLEDLIDAFALARESCRAKLLIAGYPTKSIDMYALLQRTQARNLSGHVVFDTRYIPSEEIQALMDLATVVVYPYRSSTQSGALQVAYTFEKPVIAASVGGLPEAVEDGKNGFIVPPHSPRALADKMTLFLNDPEMVARMGAHSGRLSRTRFSWQSVAREIVMVFDRLRSSTSGERTG